MYASKGAGIIFLGLSAGLQPQTALSAQLLCLPQPFLNSSVYNDILSGSDTSIRSLGLGLHDLCVGLTPRALNIKKQQQ